MRERASFLSFSPPAIGEEEIAAVVDTLRSGWITTGPKVARFEHEFAAFIGAESALGLSSCTAALHLSLVALGIGPGDHVVTTPMTFCSSVHVVEQAGATPVFVDVEPDTLNVDPGAVARIAESHSVKAILPVHLYGHPCEMDALLEVARARDLPLIEDAAHALPASYGGRTIGAPVEGATVLTCFSFYATKNLTTGEGGMLTGPPDLVEEARRWSMHGIGADAWERYADTGSWYYEVDRAGFKYNMTDVQAAMGLKQLAKLPALQARRHAIARRYDEAFAPVEEIEVPACRPGIEHARHLYPIRLNLDRLRISRAAFIEELKRRKIGAGVHFVPVHMHPYYREKYGYRPDDFPVARDAYERLVSLPLHPGMTDRDTGDVIEAVTEIVEANRS